jgi:transposase
LPYARVSEVMRDLFSCPISRGTLFRQVGSCAAELAETELKIKRKLRCSSVIHTDETGLRVEKKCHYIHVTSSQHLTHYACDVRRGRGAVEEIDILPRYRGTCVHDGWLSYTYYPQCRHSLCCAHLLRELTFFEELSEAAAEDRRMLSDREGGCQFLPYSQLYLDDAQAGKGSASSA